MQQSIAHYHLPGLFEFFPFYQVFLPLFKEHREYFYDWCTIDSIYGAPADCLWGGGREGIGEENLQDVLSLLQAHGISARLTFSNSLLREEHLSDKRCNTLCTLFSQSNSVPNGIIVHSDLLLSYLKENYSNLYYVSSTTKVLTEFEDLKQELRRPDFSFVVPDFRLNKAFAQLNMLTDAEKQKIEFLCNECCWIDCWDRKSCYENVSHKNLGDNVPDHICCAPDGTQGYRFSKAMRNPSFIGFQDIQSCYLPQGFFNFKIEGRGLGSALLLEFLLYYLTRPEYQLEVREKLYLDSALDLF